MITVLNQKELTVTYNIKRQGEIRDILAQNNIDYRVKVINRESPSPMAAGSRARMGSFGTKAELMYEYIFFVKKTDYERAKGLLRCNSSDRSVHLLHRP